jgi:hypothetical protein
LDERGRRRRFYRAADYLTPYEKLRSLPEAYRYLKEGLRWEFRLLPQQEVVEVVFGTGRIVSTNLQLRETTHDDLRCAVETPSGGWDRRGVLPRLLTIYAAQFRNVRPGGGQPS